MKSLQFLGCGEQAARSGVWKFQTIIRVQEAVKIRENTLKMQFNSGR
jgi:hypothetical protein